MIAFSVKQQVKRILTSVGMHRQGQKKDILILSSARSGSTWLMELIGTEPGMRCLYEPLGKRVLDHHRLLPIRHRWNYVSLAPDEEPAFKNYFLDEEQTRIFGPRNPFGRTYHPVTNRRVFKVIRANALIDWFERNLDFHIVYLIRHPIAQSLSCIRRGHSCEIQDYLRDESFVHRWLDDELVQVSADIAANGNQLERFVLEYCLDNLVPLRTLRDRPDRLVVTYEELVLRPAEIVAHLCETLELRNKEGMLAAATIPSRTTDSSTRAARGMIKAGEAEQLLGRWRRQVEPQQQNRLFGILERFGIDAYRPGRSIAAPHLLNFADAYAAASHFA